MAILPRTAGIYRIDGPNGKVYIGSTKDFRQRWRAHQSDLRIGDHPSRHMQHAWNKYGEECFTFTIVEVVENIKDLRKREQIWLNTLFASLARGKIYNTRTGTPGRLCSDHHTEDTKRRLSATSKAHWEQKSDAEKAQIRATLDAIRGSAHERLAELRKQRNPPKEKQRKLFGGNVGRIAAPDVLENQSRAHRKGKIYNMIAPDGTVYEDIGSLTSFGKEHGMTAATVHNILHGKHKNLAGWTGYITYAA